MPPYRPGPWDVVRGHCHQTTPAKVKRVLCVRLEDDHFLGFFFNTSVNPWVQERPHILQYHLPFVEPDRTYLDRDCYLDTTQAFVFHYFQQWERLGEMSLEDAERVRAVIEESPHLPPKTVRSLLT